MKRLQKVYLQLFLVLCVTVSLTSVFPTPALSHQAALPIQVVYLDECAVDGIAPATPQSEGAYVANSNTGKFHCWLPLCEDNVRLRCSIIYSCEYVFSPFTLSKVLVVFVIQ